MRARGVTKLGKAKSEDIALEFYDVVIMNPPFTRQERIPQEYKKRLIERFESYNEYLDGQMSYYAYFILLADKFLRIDGKIALVLPASFLRTKSTEGIRKMLSEKYEIQFVITGMGQLNFSDATWKREILLVAKKRKKGEKSHITKFVAIPALPKTAAEALKITQLIKDLKEGQKNDCGLVLSFVDSENLKKDLDWFRFITSFEGYENVWEKILSRLDGLERFGSVYDLESVIKRGIETRGDTQVQPFLIPKNEDRAIRKEDVWIATSEDENGLTVHNKDVESLTVRIPKRSYKAALRTTAGNNRINLNGETDYVVTSSFKDSDTFFFGERKQLLRKLPSFSKYVTERMGNIVIQRRFPIGAIGSIHISYYSPFPVASVATTWVGNLPDEDARILCLWFNSSFHLAQLLYERIEDVWIDVHKYNLEELLVINPKSLSGKDRKTLLKVFDDICEKEFPSLKLQYERESSDKYELDKAILATFGVSDKIGEKLLSEIYSSIRAYFKSVTRMEKKS